MIVALTLIGICSTIFLIKFVEGFIAGWREADREERAEWHQTESRLIEEHRRALIKRYRRENIHDLDR
jgi:hypothetical protein